MSLANQGKRNKPTFEDVGSVKENEEVSEEVIEDEDVEHTVDSIVDSIIHAPKEKPKKQISIYLDVDVAKAFERFGNKQGKGSKSDLINKFLKKALDV